MESILEYLQLVPPWAWQIVAFFIPSNKVFQFLLERLGLERKTSVLRAA